MPPPPKDPTDPRAWLRRARSNLAQARGAGLPDVLFEDLCFDAQQAAEKAIKAVLVHIGAEFPKTHDINRLLTIGAASGLAIPDEIREADRLTRHAVQSRYPGPWEVSEDDYRRAVAMAEHVLSWAASLIEPPGSESP
jgi:HEPN domain-containing protein